MFKGFRLPVNTGNCRPLALADADTDDLIVTKSVKKFFFV